MKKLIITGYSGHGKDTVAEILKILGYSFESSSMWMLENHLWDAWDGVPYRSKQAMFEDRHNHRQWWKDTIKTINKEKGLSYLGDNILKEHDIYCGLRDYEELQAIKANHDVTVIFVSAVARVEICKADREGALTIAPSDCDAIIDNNGTVGSLMIKVARGFGL